ncbi:hypothetical protein Tco_1121662 [Tanacetum coccineum]|uniref:Uncharacterized protein n=1 Tax=Tanacetum coccineum TaxID=301880 RepID=A0ABQ5IYA3_9ASTR
MGDENPLRTLGDYSKPSHEGYKNTIELPAGNNMTYLTLTVKIGKERACVYFNFPYAIKLAIGLNAFQQDPSPYGRILLPDSLLNSFYREGPTDSDTEEEDDSSTNACDLNPGGLVKGKEEVKEKGKEEDEETDMEVEEVIEEEESEFETDEEVEEIFKEEEEDEDDENFNSFPTMKELSHHEWLLKNP